MYSDEAVVKDAINAIQEDEKRWEFEKCLECVTARVPLLYDFFGGLATVFPGTATVESDLSQLKRKWSLSDFSL
jgi:hypothetical protein